MILSKQLHFNTLPLFDAANERELRHRLSRNARKLRQRYGLSPSMAEAIARANGLGPTDER